MPTPTTVGDEKFTMRFDGSTPTPTVFIRGTISMQEPMKVLDPFFTDVHQHLVAGQGAAVDIDVTQVEFLSSSALKSLIRWARQIQELPKPKRYSVCFRTSPARHWQASLAPLCAFAPEIMRIQVKG